MIQAWFQFIVEALQADLPRFLLIGVLLVILGTVEYFFPAQPDQSLSGRIRNLLYITSFFVLGIAFLALFETADTPTAPRIQESIVSNVTLLVLLSLLFSDLLFYVYHRVLHAKAWAWPIHELHHADTELNATSSLRTYWFELPVQALFIATPTQLLLGGHPTAQVWVMFVSTTWLFFTHANIRLQLGMLSSVVAGPQVHRIHHSNKPEHQDKNFAQFFPFIDVLFGTYYHPKKGEFPTTGTQSLAVDASFFAVLVRPFRQWLKI